MAHALKADGLDDAVIGLGRRCGQMDLIVYDAEKILEILVQRDGMTYEEAREFYEFNIVGAWVGKGTPIFVEPMSMEEILVHIDGVEEEDDA
jgi:hypothetical protein